MMASLLAQKCKNYPIASLAYPEMLVLKTEDIMADRERLVAWARMMVSLLEEAELWDDIYIALAGHLTLREIFEALIERGLITEDEGRELGIHPDAVPASLPDVPGPAFPSNVLPMRRIQK